jgi:hypothetical protein
MKLFSEAQSSINVPLMAPVAPRKQRQILEDSPAEFLNLVKTRIKGLREGLDAWERKPESARQQVIRKEEEAQAAQTRLLRAEAAKLEAARIKAAEKVKRAVEDKTARRAKHAAKEAANKKAKAEAKRKKAELHAQQLAKAAARREAKADARATWLLDRPRWLWAVEAAPMVIRDDWAVVAPGLIITHSQTVGEQKQPSVDGSSGLDQYMPNAVGTDLINRAADEADVGETESASQEGRVRDES